MENKRGEVFCSPTLVWQGSIDIVQYADAYALLCNLSFSWASEGSSKSDWLQVGVHLWRLHSPFPWRMIYYCEGSKIILDCRATTRLILSKKIKNKKHKYQTKALISCRITGTDIFIWNYKNVLSGNKHLDFSQDFNFCMQRRIAYCCMEQQRNKAACATRELNNERQKLRWD